MARAVDDGKEFRLLIIGVLLSIAGYLVHREFDALDAKAIQIDRHLESTDGQVNTLAVAVAVLQTKIH